jgi:Tol biopolymer transport system component
VAALVAAAAVVTLLALPRIDDLRLPTVPGMVSAPPVQSPVQTEVPPAISADGRASQPGSEEPAGATGPTEREAAATEGATASAPAPRDRDPAAEPASLAAEPMRGAAGAETSWSPAFASVGSAMFYHAEAGRGGPSDVVRAETDGEGTVLRITRVVDDHARNFHARPSPDGSRIAFDSDRDGERGVYIADADGANVRRVSGEGFAAVPSWSPDGETLAFVRGEPGRPHVWNLWLLHLPTNEFRRLTSYRYGQLWGGSWFPDGRRIAYSHEDRLVVLEIESGRDRIFDSPRKGRLVRTPAVSPDGGRIIFQVHRDGAWLLDLSDESMRKVLADPTAEEYAWSPDGRRVAYHSRRSGHWGVWLMASR